MESRYELVYLPLQSRMDGAKYWLIADSIDDPYPCADIGEGKLTQQLTRISDAPDGYDVCAFVVGIVGRNHAATFSQPLRRLNFPLLLNCCLAVAQRQLLGS